VIAASHQRRRGYRPYIKDQVRQGQKVAFINQETTYSTNAAQSHAFMIHSPEPPKTAAWHSHVRFTLGMRNLLPRGQQRCQIGWRKYKNGKRQPRKKTAASQRLGFGKRHPVFQIDWAF
jgi:hypothetical protein